MHVGHMLARYNVSSARAKYANQTHTELHAYKRHAKNAACILRAFCNTEGTIVLRWMLKILQVREQGKPLIYRNLPWFCAYTVGLLAPFRASTIHSVSYMASGSIPCLLVGSGFLGPRRSHPPRRTAGPPHTPAGSFFARSFPSTKSTGKALGHRGHHTAAFKQLEFCTSETQNWLRREQQEHLQVSSACFAGSQPTQDKCAIAGQPDRDPFVNF